VERASKAVVLAALVALAVLGLLQLKGGWWLQDADAYWSAAMRLRDGDPLYPALASQDASKVYRYAPWFAAAWMPLTYLPQQAAYVTWEAACLVAAGYCVWRVAATRRAAAVLLAILVGALLLPAAASGNVQPVLLALLMFGLERRSGPLWIAVAASLKAAPILLLAVYVGRRQWDRVMWTLLLAIALSAPMLAFDLSHYPTDVAAAVGPLSAWVAVALALELAAGAVLLARTRYAWLAASAAVVFAIPRWSYYQPTFLALGLVGDEEPGDDG
jgi:hypothetical protein